MTRRLPSQLMGRQRTAEDYFQAVEANGRVAGAHEDGDRVVQEKGEPSDSTRPSELRGQAIYGHLWTSMDCALFLHNSLRGWMIIQTLA
jgi:hypothetical protein